MKKSGQKGEEYLEKLIGKANNTPTVKDKIIGHLPDVLIYIFTIISLIIIYKILGCFCKPKICHGDILAAIANS